jgi:formate hydrogenlyase subunit 6/NADH:ubiquinone oxidoreductase subunit I
MAFKVTSSCSGKDTICEDICPYNCVQTVDAAPDASSKHFQIDPEQCTDCGACALACPESAIVHAEAFAASRPKPNLRMPTVRQVAVEVGDSERAFSMKVEVPEGFLVLNGKIESWASLMGSSCD